VRGEVFVQVATLLQPVRSAAEKEPEPGEHAAGRQKRVGVERPVLSQLRPRSVDSLDDPEEQQTRRRPEGEQEPNGRIPRGGGKSRPGEP
jgi:hypothetical protein